MQKMRCITNGSPRESGIRHPERSDPESGIQNTESGIRNPEYNRKGEGGAYRRSQKGAEEKKEG